MIHRTISRQALEMIAIRELKKYKNGSFLFDNPCAVPIEDMLENQYGLSVEFHQIRKSGSVLGQTVFEDSLTPIYDAEKGEYTLIEVTAGTIIADIRLLHPKCANRLRFTYAHELAHWLIHKEVFKANAESAALIRQGYGDDITERQADFLCAELLMPGRQLKKAFYQARTDLHNSESSIPYLAELFQVAAKTMEISLKQHNLI